MGKSAPNFKDMEISQYHSHIHVSAQIHMDILANVKEAPNYAITVKWKTVPTSLETWEVENIHSQIFER